ncbi:MAG: aminoglycoside phosphotransferase family protein [Hyphomicrobiales bacterium]
MSFASLDLPGRSISLLMQGAEWAAKVVSSSGLRSRTGAPSRRADEEVEAFLRSLGTFPVSTWQHLGEMPSLPHVRIDFIGEASDSAAFLRGFAIPPATRAILKRSGTPSGMAALRQQAGNLRQLAAENATRHCCFRVPEILALRKAARTTWSLESYIAGHDGRLAVLDADSRMAVLVAASDAISSLQTTGAALRPADEAWVAEWVEKSCAIAGGVVRTIATEPTRVQAIDTLSSCLAHHFKDQPVSSGWYHGDYCPGNLIVDSAWVEGDRNSGRGAIAGIIDWDRAGHDAPPNFDICQLAIALRRTLTGRQLGTVVADLIAEGRWSDDELTWFSQVESLKGSGGEWTRDPDAMRAMVLLVWLRLVRSNIEKSPPFASNRLWSAANVEWVLRAVSRR